jgi:transcriptional regulator with XRE-family HTH domain
MTKIEKKIGERLKFIRLERGLTQENLAELSDLHRTYIGSVERGERNITVKNLYKILIAVDYSLSDFFETFK